MFGGDGKLATSFAPGFIHWSGERVIRLLSVPACVAHSSVPCTLTTTLGHSATVTQRAVNHRRRTGVIGMSFQLPPATEPCSHTLGQ